MKEKSVKVSGHVCTIKLIAMAHMQKEDWDDEIVNWLRDHYSPFEAEVREQVYVHLGPQFKISSIKINRGTVEVSVMITTVGLVYYAISRYKNFVESLELLVYQLRKVLQRFCGPHECDVTGSWIPGPGFTEVPEETSQPDLIVRIVYILVLYLILTNMALLAYLAWLLTHK